jgi:peptidoglycan/xylan/chitin deacetylase (PgdA/CDA1 family)
MKQSLDWDICQKTVERGKPPTRVDFFNLAVLLGTVIIGLSGQAIEAQALANDSGETHSIGRYPLDIEGNIFNLPIFDENFPLDELQVERAVAKTNTFDGKESNTVGYPPTDIHGNESFLQKDVFITIDDCYDLPSLEIMFSTLRQRGLKATIFPNTMYQDPKNPETVKLWQEIYADGFTIGYHTTHHVAGLTEDQLVEDRDQFEKIFQQLLGDPGFRVQYVRAPFGMWDASWLKWVQDNQLTNVRWNEVPNAKTTFQEVEDAFRYPTGGGIILLHARPFDARWLTDSIDQLVHMAGSAGGKVTTIDDGVRAMAPIDQVTASNSP